VATHEEGPGIQFRWTNGKFVPDVNDYLYKNLTGKPLPSLEGFMKGLEQDYDRDKMLLVCFFDMNQRPSRNSIQQLSKRAQELKAKGVVVVAVQASKVDQNTLDEWIKKNNIPFPVGMVQDDEERTRLAWGVRSLPWLILTDRKHIVRAEGFALAELDRKLEQLGDRP
jgi:peroxiredoxin